MKKFLTVILTISILLVSVISLDSFAASKSENIFLPNSVATPATPSEPITPDKLLAPEWSEMIWETQRISADCVLTKADGTKSTGTVNSMGTNGCMTLTVNFITMSTLITNEKTYIYFPNFPFFHISMKNTASPMLFYNWPASDLIEAYYESGYQVEKYKYDNYIYTYYFEGNEIHTIESYNIEAEEFQVYTNISCDVKLKDVILPPTAVFDATWFLTFILYFCL